LSGRCRLPRTAKHLTHKSALIEARADEALINTHKNLLKDDELIIVMGKLQPDRFSGGMQLTVTQIWDLDQARCRFGKYLKVEVGTGATGKVPDVARLLKEFPPRREMSEQCELVRGLGVRLVVQRMQSGAPGTSESAVACAELQLGDDARFYPSDAALAQWRAQTEQGRAVVAYE
jgi:DNA polymerase III subunit alpha